MKQATFVILIALLCSCHSSRQLSQQATEQQQRINIYVFDNPHKKKLFSQTVYWRAKWHAMWSKGKMYAFRATTPEDAANRIETLLKERNAMIGHLYFDSHGYYYNRLSAFQYGGKRITYLTIKADSLRKPLERIAAYCDSGSKVTLGACFTAATYDFPDKDTLKGRRMNGDSLLLTLGGIFNRSTIYGSQSWVMESPGLWSGGYKLAGGPGQRIYKDVLFKPAWETLGRWTKFNPKTGRLEECNPVAMNKKGDAWEKEKPFQSFEWVQQKIRKTLPKLKPNRYPNKLRVEL